MEIGLCELDTQRGAFGRMAHQASVWAEEAPKFRGSVGGPLRVCVPVSAGTMGALCTSTRRGSSRRLPRRGDHRSPTHVWRYKCYKTLDGGHRNLPMTDGNTPGPSGPLAALYSMGLTEPMLLFLVVFVGYLVYAMSRQIAVAFWLAAGAVLLHTWFRSDAGRPGDPVLLDRLHEVVRTWLPSEWKGLAASVLPLVFTN